MALFGQTSDIDTFKLFARELMGDIISQMCGYYKLSLDDTSTDIYNEGNEKFYIGPVLLNCLIDRGDYESTVNQNLPDVNRIVTFKFLRDDMIQANIVPEIGDILMYNEVYYEVDNVNQNQLILGKDKDYSYTPGLEKFGDNYSVVLTTHYTRGDRLGITRQR